MKCTLTLLVRNLICGVFLAIFLSSCLKSFVSKSEPDCNFSQFKGLRIAWKQLPVNLFMDNALNNLQRKALTQAVNSIHKQYNKKLFNLIFGVSPSTKWQNQWAKFGILKKDGKSSVYWISTAWPQAFWGKQAITRTSSRGNQIKETDIVINASIYDFFLDIIKPRGLDLQSLYMHELLHSIGLKHVTSDPISVMKPSLAQGAQPQRRILSSLDKQSLNCEY